MKHDYYIIMTRFADGVVVKIEGRDKGDSFYLATPSNVWNESPANDWKSETLFFEEKFAKDHPEFRIKYLGKNDVPSYVINNFYGEVT